ncbi:hypothetical protein BH20ACT2_BH20ACT2_10060 [soil metagenome]
MEDPELSSDSLSRRRLFKLAGVAGGALALDMAGFSPWRQPAGAQADAGAWSDPATWGGSVPGPADLATVSQPVLLDVDASVAGVVIVPGGELIFDPGRSITLSSSANVVVQGKLAMRPVGAAVQHRLVFTGVNEGGVSGAALPAKFCRLDPDGGAVGSDIGLWVTGAGTLDLVGAPKTAWARLAGSAAPGNTVLSLDRVPAGWAVGDRIAVTPTTAPRPGDDTSWMGFSEAAIATVSGSRVTLDQPLAHDHPMIAGTWAAEVLNLSRTVSIEGTPGGRAHTLVRSSQPQRLSHVEFRHGGPRKDGEKITGRWPLHFHHCGDGSRGTVVEGVVVAQAGSHAFVPHLSHGITFRDCIAYDVEEHAFWWDDGDCTDDTVFESCVAAGVLTAAFGAAGFYLAKGERNVVRDCVATGVRRPDGAGFTSPGQVSNGRWTMVDCRSHNNRHAGFKAYINTNRRDDKRVSALTAFHNGVGIDHGAYKNSFRYEGCTLYGNPVGIALSAVANQMGLAFVDTVIDQAGLGDYGVINQRHFQPADQPTVFEGCTFRGHNAAAIAMILPNPKSAELIDLVGCTFEGNELFLADDVNAASVVRFQDAVHGSLAAQRKDRPGTAVPEWNASVTTVGPFA